MIYSDIPRLLKESLGDFYPLWEYESMARLIVEAVTGLTWIQIQISKDQLFTADQDIRIQGIIARLKTHEPIQYILGETEFYGLRIKIRPGVLIPRGETEELVEWIIQEEKEKGKREKENDLRILDVGCGSGAIAIALAKNLPDAEIIAADISEEALAITKENAGLNGVPLSTVNFNILIPEPLGGSFDLIVSNPPYIPQSDSLTMARHVKDYEPEAALFVPDDDPLLFYRAIAEYAMGHLATGGEVFVEIHERMGEKVTKLFRQFFNRVELRKDIHGKDRMIRAYNG